MSTRPRQSHETKAARARRERWKRIGVWIFILIFAFSVAGGVVAFTVH